MFEAEIGKAYDCVVHPCDETKYKVAAHTIEFNLVDDTLVCSCKKFEFTGILCSHALKVLSLNNITKIPARYVLQRWTRHAKLGSTIGMSEYNINEEPKITMARHYKERCRL